MHTNNEAQGRPILMLVAGVLVLPLIVIELSKIRGNVEEEPTKIDEKAREDADVQARRDRREQKRV